MKVAFAIIAIFGARLLVSALYYQGHDADLAWQQWLGAYILHAHHLPARLGSETFTSTGSAWVPQEWAFSVAVAWAAAAKNFVALAACAAAAACGALLLTAYRAYRRGASAFTVALVTAFTGFAMLQSFGVRAQVFGWLFLAIVLLLLDVETDALFLAIPVIAIWANIHASALIAPVLIIAWTAGTWIEDRAWTPRVERNFVVAVGSVLAVCLTPLLWHLPQYALELQTSAIRSAISEWQPPDIGFSGFSAGLLPLLVLCCYFGIAAPRERWRDGMLFAVAAVLGVLAVRHVPIAALIIAPMAAQRLATLIPAHSRINAILREQTSETLIFASTALVCAVIAVNLVKNPAVSGVTLPKSAVATLAALPGRHNLYCEDFAWCSLALQERNLRTFLDGRCDPFPPRVWKDYLAVQRVAPSWQKLLVRWNVDSVLVSRTTSLAQAIALRRDWHLFYRDGRYEIFLRQNEATAER